MENYGPQLPTLPKIPQIPLMPQVQEQQQQGQGNQAQGGGVWMPGATTVGAVFNGGVILASEKRVTYGNFIMSRGGKKVFKVTDTNRRSMRRPRRRHADSRPRNGGTSQPLQHGCRKKNQLYAQQQNSWQTYCSTADTRHSITQTIIGGLDEDGATLFVLDVLGRLIPDKYAVVGSGTETAMGVLEEGFKETMSAERSKRARYPSHKVSHKQRRHERRRHRLPHHNQRRHNRRIHKVLTTFHFSNF